MRRTAAKSHRPAKSAAEKRKANSQSRIIRKSSDSEDDKPLKYGLHSPCGPIQVLTSGRPRKRSSKATEAQKLDVTLPSPDRPNFIRRVAGERVITTSFEDRWQAFLEAKRLNNARIAIYLRVYFRRWRLRYSGSYVERIRERTKLWSASNASLRGNTHTSKVDAQLADTLDLIKLARSKIDELSYPGERTRKSAPPRETETSDECSLDDTSIPEIESPSHPPQRSRTQDSDLGNKSLLRSHELQIETERILNEESLSDGVPTPPHEAPKPSRKADPSQLPMSTYARSGDRSLADSLNACANPPQRRGLASVSFDIPVSTQLRSYTNAETETSFSTRDESSLGLEFNIINSSEAEDL